MAAAANHSPRVRSRYWTGLKLIRTYILALGLSLLVFTSNLDLRFWRRTITLEEQAYRVNVLEQCSYLKSPAGPPTDFHTRAQSDRFVPGTKAVLVQNAKIWTAAQNGTEIVYGDILLDKGLIKAIGFVSPELLKGVDYTVHDAQGSWVTPGIVDLHSHIGVGSAPQLRGAADTNSRKAPILPWLRSIDGLNTHDASYELARSGGVTTAQILPGSANNIGGQAYVIKLRDTEQRSPISMVVEPPYSLNGSEFDHSLTPRWRHMKHACGENPSRVYSQTRMDSAWNFRQAYNEARKLRDSQDQFCAKAEDGLWDELGAFPEDLQWEALADVLRGKVKLSVHCYEAVDLDVIVRLSHEFKFPVASFHHAGETYLVPDLLKSTYGGTPSIALFASNFKKKREAYRGSEFAPRVLAANDIPVVMKSDHPVVNSRYLLHEATQAYYYGLEDVVALASVTSTPAKAMGLSHRIGYIREGYDADLVVWDSHPLALAATPRQVYIDGIPQFDVSYVSEKPESFQVLPKVPNFDREAAEAVAYEGLPPLEPRKARTVIFHNVNHVYTRSGDHIVALVDHETSESMHSEVVVQDGTIVCSGTAETCSSFSGNDIEIVDLKGGSIMPGLTTFGAPLGLVEIRLEASTNDGNVHDPLDGDPPSILGGNTIIRAVDGLQFGGRNTLLSYRGGVTTAVTAPVGSGFIQGASTAFSVGASTILDDALVKQEVALHVSINRSSGSSVSTQIAALRWLLFGTDSTQVHLKGNDIVQRVRAGESTLVVDVDSADIMGTLLLLKAEYEKASGKRLQLTFAGASEAHLIAKEISKAGVSVIVTLPKPFPDTWDQRRILLGPPVTAESIVTVLLEAGVNVGIGVVDEAYARNTRFEVAWAALESNGTINRAEALALATTNLEKALGLVDVAMPNDLVAYEGGDIFDIQSKVVAVICPRAHRTDLFV
ncbi:hypothetical protein SERLADRAFT_417630 [Serpula lacrymans var. lacrymans S7.9]|uniref:Amidohydrolase-related domain-containing protein n=1 Tax=Serpula lacrymans var. lacrymans (strain S7.9) TaxID=578457 RepID=F8P784_SERL9|nr:uncharacterized protein SERLADRAFT_417630 [Serpula lacrymans var. lacrymans S7.9]EGO21300.1 hypothetical protein SERLADRAFT_417630 [Serpula lacrymans var. lacrymans S7.9]